MATELKFDKENDKEKKNISLAPQIGAGEGAFSTAQPYQKPTSSGRFTNIQNYLTANRNNNLGQNITNRISGVASDVNKDVSKEREQFQNKTAEAFKPFVGGKSFAEGGIQNAAQFLTDNPNTPEDESKANLQRFTTIRQGQYGGPQQLANLAGLQAGAQNVSTLANLTNNEAGRQTLLGSFFNRPNYSQGQKSLDNLLLQADPNQTKALKATGSISASANRNLTQADIAARQEAAQKMREASVLGKDITSQLSKENLARNKELDEKLAQVQNEEINKQNAYNQALKDIQSGVISASDAARLGLNVEDNAVNTYGLNLADYLNTNLYEGPMTREAVSDQEQAARLNALARLSGSQSGPLNMSNVGKYSASSQNIKSSFGSDVERNRALYNELKAQEEAQRAKYNRLEDLYKQVDLGRQQAAIEAAQSGRDVSAVNAAYGASPAYNQLVQEVMGGEAARDIGMKNQVYNALQSQKANALNELEAKLAALRKQLRVVNR